jgi:hypothetical protein
LYEAEFYEELPEGAILEKEIEVIVLQLLRDFSFLKADEEYHDVDDIDEDSCKEKLATENTQNEQSNLHNLKSNYFQKQLRCMAAKYTEPNGGKDDDERDDMSDI